MRADGGPPGAPSGGGVIVRRLQAAELVARLDGLVDVLVDSVDGGASVGFLAPLGRARAERFWRGVVEAVGSGDRVVVIAEDASGVLGTGQLVLATADNQAHRADVAKVLVHRRARRRGLAPQLLAELEAAAAALGRTTLVLDTVTGSDADRLYRRLGWVEVGAIPRYAVMPDGAPCSTTYFYKLLPPRG
jgi:GNAT superfamily N-acetyltransferase